MTHAQYVLMILAALVVGCFVWRASTGQPPPWPVRLLALLLLVVIAVKGRLW